MNIFDLSSIGAGLPPQFRRAWRVRLLDKGRICKGDASGLEGMLECGEGLREWARSRTLELKEMTT